jgi:hypothetical protein
MPITQNNVIAIVAAGAQPVENRERAQQYAQNQGLSLRAQLCHGKQPLANLLASLILLAFLGSIGTSAKHVRGHLSSRRTFFEHLRALTCYFDSWEHLFDAMIEALQLAQPPPRRRAGKP